MIKKYFKEALLSMLLPGAIMLIIGTAGVFLRAGIRLNLQIIGQRAPLSIAICFIAPLVTVLKSFRYLKHGSDNDFYNSLPISRLQLFCVHAAASLCVSLLSAGLPLLLITVIDGTNGIPMFMLQGLSAVLWTWGATLVAVTLSRGSMWAMLIASELVFLPSIIYSFIVDMFADRLPMISDWNDQLFDRLLGARFSPIVAFFIPYRLPSAGAVVCGAVIAVLFMLVAAILYKKDARPTVTTYAFPLALLFIPAFYYGEMFGGFAFTLFLTIAFLVFTLTVLLKFKNAVKIVKSFAFLAVLIAVFGGIRISAFLYDSYCFNAVISADTVDEAYIEVTHYDQLYLNDSNKNPITDKQVLSALISDITDDSPGSSCIPTGNTNTVVKFNTNGLPVYKSVFMSYDTAKAVQFNLIETLTLPENSDHISFNESWGFESLSLDFNQPFFEFFNSLSENDKFDLMHLGIADTECAIGYNRLQVGAMFDMRGLYISTGFDFYLNAADCPKLLDIANRDCTPDIVITDYIQNLEDNTGMNRYFFEDIRLAATISDEAAAIFKNAVTRSFEDVYNELGKEQFLKGGVFCLKDGKYGYGEHLIYLTPDEYEAVKNGIYE